MQPTLNPEKLQELREKYLAPLAHELDAIANERPELGQFVTSSFHHVRYAFNDLGHALALLKGLDPFANKVQAPNETAPDVSGVEPVATPEPAPVETVAEQSVPTQEVPVEQPSVADTQTV